MTRPPAPGARALAVPSGRLARLARLGAMATGIAGRAALDGTRELGRGARPALRDLLITPSNLRRLAEELARMRGAAMKVGQILSMDAGEVLPPELAEVLARLRDDAHHMPPPQLKRVLNANWGQDWLPKFESFGVRPVAAASIGQVHRARLRDGRDVAVKVQYPGVARSIDSDVTNVGALVRLSGLLPKGFDLAPYLAEARAQLHAETDYLREGRNLAAFGERLADDTRFVLPDFHADWSTREVLVMSFVAGEPVEEVANRTQADRDRVATALIDLALQELLDFGEVQSDPNFANFRHDAATGRIVLLDFGATRRIDPGIAALYRRLLVAGRAGDDTGLRAAATGLGFVPAGDDAAARRIFAMIAAVFAALNAAPAYDFTDRDLPRRIQAEALELANTGYVPPTVPMDVLYLQRKFGGLFQLATRLGARVPLRGLIDAQLDATACHPAD